MADQVTRRDRIRAVRAHLKHQGCTCTPEIAISEEIHRRIRQRLRLALLEHEQEATARAAFEASLPTYALRLIEHPRLLRIALYIRPSWRPRITVRLPGPTRVDPTPVFVYGFSAIGPDGRRMHPHDITPAP